MLKLRSVAAASVVALGLGISGAHAGLVAVELTKNGGFELGNYTGWTQFPTADGQQTITGDAAGGSFASNIRNNEPSSNSLFKQANLSLPGGLIPGETVTIKFSAKGSFGVGGVAFAEFFSEKEGGGVNKAQILGGAPLNVNADSYTDFMFMTTVASLGQGGAPGGVTLQLGATTGGDPASFAIMFYDNVSVTVMREMAPIPEPGTYAMMLAGLAGLGLIARRRRA